MFIFILNFYYCFGIFGDFGHFDSLTTRSSSVVLCMFVYLTLDSRAHAALPGTRRKFFGAIFVVVAGL